MIANKGLFAGLLVGLSVGVLLLFGFWVEEKDAPLDAVHPATLQQGATTTTALQRPLYKTVTTTLFWVGEGADATNEFISNAPSFWDQDWQQHFGGVDTPECRDGYHPCAFVPKENPFYFALPYADFTEEGVLKDNVTKIPWYQGTPPEGVSVVKNKWIEIVKDTHTCYAQWEDTGPFVYDDTQYVFGTGHPQNTKNNNAGLDVSPAVWSCLGLMDNDKTSWRFVRAAEVPPGPWKEIVTTSQINWH